MTEFFCRDCDDKNERIAYLEVLLAEMTAACALVFPTLCGLLMEKWGADYDKPRDAQGYVAYAALKAAIAKAREGGLT